jgi:hypothetical protein
VKEKEQIVVTRQVDSVDIERVSRAPARTWVDETKLSFLTTEFWAMVAAVIAILVATDRLASMTAYDGWRLVTFIVIGYMISRGLAKAGSSHTESR